MSALPRALMIIVAGSSLMFVPATSQAGATWAKPTGASGARPAAAISADGKTSYVAWVDKGSLKVAVNAAVKTLAGDADAGEDPSVASNRGGAGVLFGTACDTASAKINYTDTKWSTPVVVANEPCSTLSLKSSADGSKLLATWVASTDVQFMDSPTVARAATSEDGGKTWSAATDVPLTDYSSAPAYALSADGSKAVVVATRARKGDKAVAIARSADGGRTWKADADLASGTVDLIGLSLDASPDLRHIAVNWNRSPDLQDQIYGTVSHDGGESWPTPSKIGKPGDYPDNGIAISDNGKQVAAFWTRNTSNWSQTMMYARSKNGGKSWSAAMVAEGSKTGKFFPGFEMSGDGKRMIALWSGAMSRNGKQAVVAATSTGKAWRTTTVQKVKGSPFSTRLAASATGKRAVAAWQVGAKNPKVFRATAKVS